MNYNCVSKKKGRYMDVNKLVSKLIVVLQDKKVIETLLLEDNCRYILIAPTNEWIRILKEEDDSYSVSSIDESFVPDNKKKVSFELNETELLDSSKNPFTCVRRNISFDNSCIRFFVEQIDSIVINGELNLEKEILLEIVYDIEKEEFNVSPNSSVDNGQDFLISCSNIFWNRNSIIDYGNRCSPILSEKMLHDFIVHPYLKKIGFADMLKSKKRLIVSKYEGVFNIFDVLLSYLYLMQKSSNLSKEDRSQIKKQTVKKIFSLTENSAKDYFKKQEHSSI